MVRRARARLRPVAALALVLAGLVAVPAAATPATSATPALPAVGTPRCGSLDKPETGLQGEVPLLDQLTGRAEEGYNCGLALVGHVDLAGSAANMAWAGDCAYVATTGEGINVVDVSDPAHPVVTTTLHGAGSNLTIETLAAKKVGAKAVLVAGRYGPAPVPVSAPMDIYDVSDCTHPKLASTFTFPQNIHNLTISPDGNRVYATQPLQVVDIHDLAKPAFLGNLEDQIPQPNLAQQTTGQGSYLSHEAMLSPDGNTLYLGGQTPFSFAWFTIVDITGWPARPPVVLSQVPGRGHSVRLARISGRTYALHSEESIVGPTAKGCVPSELNPFAGAAQPWLSDVTDPRHPKMHLSQMTLEINDAAHCDKEIVDGEDASVHYHDVDDPARTTFVMASMWNAGLRIFDVRDPLHPKEAAYFNPGMITSSFGDSAFLDKAWGHVRYDKATGQIWFASQTGGFWVVELEPQVRSALGLPALKTRHPLGSAPRPAGAIGTAAAASAATVASPYYCTIGPVTQ